MNKSFWFRDPELNLSSVQDINLQKEWENDLSYAFLWLA